MYMDNEREYFLDSLYRRYAKRLEDFCLQYVQYQAEYRSVVDEAIQDTILQAVKSYKTIAAYPPDRLEAWLLVTCRHRLTSALRTYRTRKKHHVGPFDDARIIGSPQHTIDIIEEFIDRMDDKALVDRVLSFLTDRERRIVQKRYYQDFSPSEIADQEHMTIGAVKAVLARVKEKVRKNILKYPQNFLVLTVSFWLLMHLV